MTLAPQDLEQDQLEPWPMTSMDCDNGLWWASSPTLMAAILLPPIWSLLPHQWWFPAQSCWHFTWVDLYYLGYCSKFSILGCLPLNARSILFVIVTTPNSPTHFPMASQGRSYSGSRSWSTCFLLWTRESSWELKVTGMGQGTDFI